MDKVISIVVITYNSAGTLTETLDSIYNQKYPFIELILSDDGSSDSTRQVFLDWIKFKGSRFTSVKSVFYEKNTGIPANCNRGISLVQSDWIKLIAGDDILLPNAMTSFVLNTNSDWDTLLHGGLKSFKRVGSENVILRYYGKAPFFEESSFSQLMQLMNRNVIKAPAVCFTKKLWELNGGFNEQYKIVEDLEFWLNALSKGCRFRFVDDCVVLYRKSETSIQGSSGFFTHAILMEMRSIYRSYEKRMSHKKCFIRRRIRLRLYSLFAMSGLDSRKHLARILYGLVNFLT